MDRLTLRAPAKLNLRLLVGPIQPDGYHPIRSLMVALDDLADVLTLSPSSRRVVRCAGLDDQANLAWQALDALEARVGRVLPCAIEIEKHIPAQAGLGGGSSDAAAVLVGANELFGLGLDAGVLEGIASEVGSDVPFFVRGGAQWAEGRGERLAPAPAPSFDAVIVKPPFGLATADVYRAFDALPAPEPDDGADPPPAMPELARWVRNDLWAAATSLEHELEDLATRLVAAGARCTVLCGSGAAVAALVDDRAAAERLAAHWGARDAVFPVSCRGS